MIKYITGNLLDSNAEIIVHGVNAQGVMGSGVALAIRQKYPLAYTEYIKKHKNSGWSEGDCQIIDINYSNKHDRENKINLKYVANVCSQKYFGKDGKVYASLDAIEKGLEQVFRFAKCIDCKIALPKIGAGRGGIEWEKVEKIIKDLVYKYKVEVEIYYLKEKVGAK